MSFLMWIRLLPSIITGVVVVAKAIEEAIPEDGFGNEKLAALDAFLEDVIEASDDVSVDYGIIQPRVHKIATVMVGLFNKVGWTK